MNRTRTGALVGAVLITGVGAALTVGPSSAGASTAPASFSAKLYPGSEKHLDLGSSGFGAGDQDLFTATVVRSGKHVGHVIGSCTTVRAGATSADQLCAWSIRLAGGQITASGSVVAGQQGPGSYALPIVGGTGIYNRVAGQLKVTASNGPIPISVELR